MLIFFRAFSKMVTILAQLVASTTDSLGYITYVFKSLEDDVAALSKYIMCIRYPNWEHRMIKLGEIGYLTFVEVHEGMDKWFNGNKMIPYKYTTIQFLKFIEKQDVDYEDVM